MNEQESKPFTLSPCCGAVRALSLIFLWVERNPPYAGTKGRRTIAECVTCGKCCKPCGSLRVLPEAPKEFNAEVWREMQKKSGGDKFYCEFIDGRLEPVGGRIKFSAKVEPSHYQEAMRD